MTDHPRFERLRSAPVQGHLGYHRARLVNSVLRLIDWWRAMRGARRLGVFLNLVLRRWCGWCAIGKEKLRLWPYPY